MKIGYIVHNLNDPAVERRCEMLERGGGRVKLAGFCRDDTLSATIARRDPMILGRSADAAMIQRAFVTFKEILLNASLEAFLKDCDVIMARNLEQLAIASRLRGARGLIYECLDIHRSLTGEGAAAKAIQWVESRLLPGVDLLLTSSPAFLDHHFNHTTLKAPAHLVENKVLIDDEQSVALGQRKPGSPIVIGWFGMLRCRKTLAFLSELTKRSEGSIKVQICGKPSTAEFPDFAGQVEALDGLTYTGPYAYSELSKLYAQCHFAWAIDWFEEGQNSSWLLPNRIYEAVANGAVPIGLAGVEVGRWLARHNVGLRVADEREAMERLLSIDLTELVRLQEEVAALDRRHVISDTRDCVELVEAIAKATKP